MKCLLFLFCCFVVVVVVIVFVVVVLVGDFLCDAYITRSVLINGNGRSYTS